MFLTLRFLFLFFAQVQRNKYATAENCGGPEDLAAIDKFPFLQASTRVYSDKCYAFVTDDSNLNGYFCNGCSAFQLGLLSSKPFALNNVPIYRAHCLQTNTEDFQTGGARPDGGDSYSVTLMGYCSHVSYAGMGIEIYKYFDSVTNSHIVVSSDQTSTFDSNIRYHKLGRMCYTLSNSLSNEKTTSADESLFGEYNKINCPIISTTTTSTESTTTSTIPPKQPRVPIYRFLNGNDHFYTNSEAEYKAVLNNPTARFESIIGYMVLILEPPATVPIYRLYAHSIGHHMYAGEAEKNALVASGNWNDEGLLGYCSDTQQVGMSMLHRFYNTINYDHLFTTDQNEINHITNGNFPEWNDEGVVCSIYAKP